MPDLKTVPNFVNKNPFFSGDLIKEAAARQLCKPPDPLEIRSLGMGPEAEPFDYGPAKVVCAQIDAKARL
jgi:hypothetical protein